MTSHLQRCNHYTFCSSIRDQSRTTIEGGNNSILLPCESNMCMERIKCSHEITPHQKPQERRFWISETQITALRKGWTHTEIMDEKGILRTVWEDQMIMPGHNSNRLTTSALCNCPLKYEPDCVMAIGVGKCQNISPIATPENYCIKITQRAYEVLKMMVENNNPEDFPFNSESISEWIMEEWAGYCDANGEPDVEIG